MGKKKNPLDEVFLGRKVQELRMHTSVFWVFFLMRITAQEKKNQDSGSQQVATEIMIKKVLDSITVIYSMLVYKGKKQDTSSKPGSWDNIEQECRCQRIFPQHYLLDSAKRKD